MRGDVPDAVDTAARSRRFKTLLDERRARTLVTHAIATGERRRSLRLKGDLTAVSGRARARRTRGVACGVAATRAVREVRELLAGRGARPIRQTRPRVGPRFRVDQADSGLALLRAHVDVVAIEVEAVGRLEPRHAYGSDIGR